MGCSSSSTKTRKSETSLKAALIIQNWYRGYKARLKARQHYALTIFQSIEYADEQGQMQLSTFFSFMFENYAHVHKEELELRNQSLESEQDLRDRHDYVDLIDVPDSYNGPRLQFPLTCTDIDLLLEAFKEQQILHAHYVLEVLFETKKVLKQMPNFTHVQTSPSKELTICGDLHGKLDDLFMIFYKNGLPSESNPYVFNGDFVDRGKNSIEILIILCVSFLVYPNDLHLNRGNHEDFMMNLRYGFTKEILHKYKLHGKRILQILEELYAWLPIGTIVDNEILVIHGGISETTDLNLLHRVERNKMKSVLIPPTETNRDNDTDSKHNKVGVTFNAHGRIKTNGSPSEHLPKHEWEQIIDILWSDPRGKNGCFPNTGRGGGCYFGPDVTSKILNKYQLKMLIRSHECKPEGYEICHDGKVVTIFSASNYYEEGSNRGAYIKLCSGTAPRFFQYQVTKATCFQPLRQRVYTMESSAIKILKERVISRKSDLTRAFQLQDHRKSGKLSLSQWAFCMENILGLNLPWRSLSSNLVNIDKNGNVEYMSSFQNIHIEKPVEEAHSTLVETLYRYRSDLEIIFNAIDTDHSGLISIEEFRAMWKLFSAHYHVLIDDSQVNKLANIMDLNKDGSIDFNEFLKAFYVVHRYEDLMKPGVTNLG
ncbi:serine/threonine-protein phosphatase with EF-hands 1 isoform X1 [Macaca fascicularis]|uniref:Serine/threonine-protein phosphatase with EF-hands n=4 Tax=Macaca TaxID=9539 RepID=Q4R4Y0_MACFA|nr:serine/threonine-protein phosphatase with EF-hands 1 isoform X1 [Macaca fascicularis]XP_015298756.1 serine/threonine-protein phosphatase with EF-hands 1 isoform X1 [Macaca fascicularis]XP_045239103.1 serine/threonine-protein phosphatase with EF-hands 1 isoform X1 [Macaca fascicularis]XP_045239104.1 serine/threonine-protein phosphatase with EF-hands 1 isoform X1 [Macaca fascicularis]XP_045239105.1 serine/threonine-protein phosphatase with EF-hands 1 isoform X1 [Macaca fascicularis]XP_0452391